MNLNMGTKLVNIGYNVTKVLGRPTALAVKHSPEILMGLGSIGVVATVVMASKATLKVERINEFYDIQIKHVHIVREKAIHGQLPDIVDEQGNKKKQEYSDEDAQKDLLTVYTKRTLEYVKLYAPAATVGLLAIAAFIGSHEILSRRNMAIAAAYKLLKESYDYYRSRVVEDHGAEKDYMYAHGLRDEEVTETVVTPEGKTKKEKKIRHLVDPNAPSMYAKFFDQYSPRWCKSAEYNKAFLVTQQNFINDKLKMRGHVFLNEAYDMLGIPRTQEGAIVGWVYNAGGDDFIDFDIFNPKNCDFVNGYERAILLDFNVDGVIWNLI